MWTVSNKNKFLIGKKAKRETKGEESFQVVGKKHIFRLDSKFYQATSTSCLSVPHYSFLKDQEWERALRNKVKSNDSTFGRDFIISLTKFLALQ